MESRGSGQLRLTLEPERRIFGVGELNAAIQGMFEESFRGIFVAGEIFGCRTAASGHYYFSLKDAESQLKCVLFKGAARFARFKPQDGLAVIARGNLQVYEARGEYQLIVEALDPKGAGALQLAFEQLKNKLAADGLFEAARKRSLPRFARRIGVVTSPSGAVIRDILHVFERRFPGLHIRLFPARVQGEGSVEQICTGLAYFSAEPWAELVILARGGGSMEDLWSFNEEAVARAIAGSSIPVISAIGHETDFTISDFVADVRAPTPSAAAEIAVCTRSGLCEQIDAAKDRALKALRYRLLTASRDLQQGGVERTARLIHRRLTGLAQQVDSLDDRLRDRQLQRLAAAGRRLAGLENRLQQTNLQLRFSRLLHRREQLDGRLLQAMRNKQVSRASRLESLDLHLRQISPLAVLERGYAIVENKQRRVLRDAGDALPDEELSVQLHRGKLAVRVSGAASE